MITPRSSDITGCNTQSSTRVKINQKAVLMLFVTLSFVPAAARAQSFTVLNFPPNNDTTSVNDINVDGSVLVGQYHGHAYRWTSSDGIVHDLGTLGGSTSDAKGVSADGSIVVGVSTNSGGLDRAFLWNSANGVMQDLGTLGGSTAYAYGVSNDGQFVAGYCANSQNLFRAARWTIAPNGSTIADLGQIHPYETVPYRAFGISGDGGTVFGVLGEKSNWASFSSAFRWTAATNTMQSLPGYLPATQSCSRNGQIIVGAIEDLYLHPQQAARWNGNTLSMLGTLPGGSISIAYDVDEDGSVIVGRCYFPSGANGYDPHAVFWCPSLGGPIDLKEYLSSTGLNMTGLSLYFAQAISRDGLTVAGRGYSSTSERYVWRAVLPCSVITPHLGDVNADGRVDGRDIAPFVNFVTTPLNPTRGFCNADMNQNGQVDAGDFQPFITVLLNP